MYNGPVMDCDVHYAHSGAADILHYLPSEWQEFVRRNPTSAGPSLPVPVSYLRVDGPNRLDAVPAGGGQPGSDYQTMCDQLLDRFDIEHALLTNTAVHGLPNCELAQAFCMAQNDWTRDVWLDGIGDERLLGTVLTMMHLPEQAAAEVRRVGRDARFAAVHLGHNSLGRPLGHPIYHPIYEAAADMAMPVFTHVNAHEQFGSSANFIGGGENITFRLETYFAGQQDTVNHVTSMIVHGVFEKYPNLRYIMIEAGVSWLSWLAMRLDANYELMKAESPWVKKWPSEYLHDHCAVTTQPCEAVAESRRPFVDDLRVFDGIDDMLLFSSDYPHWDSDDPAYISSVLPTEWHEKVFEANAKRILRLPGKVGSSASSLSMPLGARRSGSADGRPLSR